MSVVTGDFAGSPYRELGEIQEEIATAIAKYDGRVPLAGVIGVLRLTEADLIRKALGETP